MWQPDRAALLAAPDTGPHLRAVAPHFEELGQVIELAVDVAACGRNTAQKRGCTRRPVAAHHVAPCHPPHGSPAPAPAAPGAARSQMVTGASTRCTLASSTRISTARSHSCFTSLSFRGSQRFNCGGGSGSARRAAAMGSAFSTAMQAGVARQCRGGNPAARRELAVGKRGWWVGRRVGAAGSGVRWAAGAAAARAPPARSTCPSPPCQRPPRCPGSEPPVERGLQAPAARLSAPQQSRGVQGRRSCCRPPLIALPAVNKPAGYSRRAWSPWMSAAWRGQRRVVRELDCELHGVACLSAMPCRCATGGRVPCSKWPGLLVLSYKTNSLWNRDSVF